MVTEHLIEKDLVMSFHKPILFAYLLLTMVGCASTALPTQQARDDRQYGALSVDDLTDSKQYAVSVAHLMAAPEVVFAKVADHQNLRDWVPMIDHLVQVDHSQSIEVGKPNVGTVRTCDFGGDTLVEDIRYWQENVGYAYSVRDTDEVAVTNHLGVMWVESDGDGGSYLIWRQFFEKKSWSLKAQLMPFMMSYVMDGAMDNLVAEFGGEVL